MAKPKFTPDAPPIGLDPVLGEYLARQFNRIEDWWPKDFEKRIQALEGLVPYKIGSWPIVDYSTVSFEAEVKTDMPEGCWNGEWPVLYSDPYKIISPKYDNTTEIEVQSAKLPLITSKDDYLSTDISTTWATPGGRSWDITYPITGSESGEGYYGIQKCPLSGQWSLQEGYIELLFKRDNAYAMIFGGDEMLLHAFTLTSPRYGFRVYLSYAGNPNGPNPLSFEVGLEDGLIRFDTGDIITHGVWRKLRIEWRPSLMSTDPLQAARLFLDEVEIFWTVGRRVGTSNTPSDIDDYSLLSDPNKEKAWLYVGCGNNPLGADTGYNGFLDNIKLINTSL